ncbi:AbrB family transcriptional regulator [Sinorhizobium meliloti]|nr:AbrB family transcriptional regulator [Sinorhizobium meliloti]
MTGDCGKRSDALHGLNRVPVLTTAIGYTVSAIVAYSAYRAHLPLAWMLGSLFPAAILSLLGLQLRPHRTFRRFGQACVGAGIGLNMTAPVLAQLIVWLPVMVGTALTSVLLSSVVAAGLARGAKIDMKTAFFASLPGGLSEMGNIGLKMGARPEPIVIVQTLRVTLVVIVIPPALVAFGLTGSFTPPAAEPVAAHLVIALLIGGSFVAIVLNTLRLNNPWTIGAVIFAATLASAEMVTGRMPSEVLSCGQFLMGFAVGSHFRPEMLRKMPRVSIFGTFSVLALTALTAGLALLLSSAFGLSFTVSALATAPGGMSEMSATAQALHVAVPFVVGFQVLRGVLVNGLASHYYTLLSKIGFLGVLQKVARVP